MSFFTEDDHEMFHPDPKPCGNINDWISITTANRLIKERSKVVYGYVAQNNWCFEEEK